MHDNIIVVSLQEIVFYCARAAQKKTYVSILNIVFVVNKAHFMGRLQFAYQIPAIRDVPALPTISQDRYFHRASILRMMEHGVDSQLPNTIELHPLSCISNSGPMVLTEPNSPCRQRNGAWHSLQGLPATNWTLIPVKNNRSM